MHQKNIQVERLWQVIVGTGLKPVEHVLRTTAGGEHQDRRKILTFAQGFCNLKAVDARQHDVENDRVKLLFGGLVEPRFAGVGVYGFVALGLEVKSEAVGQVFFVFDNEYFHQALGGCYPKSASLAFAFAFNADAATMPDDDRTNDCETEASAFGPADDRDTR